MFGHGDLEELPAANEQDGGSDGRSEADEGASQEDDGEQRNQVGEFFEGASADFAEGRRFIFTVHRYFYFSF
jgi:hypothetical protein